MRKTGLLFFAAFLGGIFSASAQSADSATTTSQGTLGINGYVDTYYMYNLNDPTSRLNQARVFDTKHNNFSLGLVQTAVTYTKGKMKVVADLTFGPNAELGNFGNIGSSAINIKQAYGTYNFTDKLAFTIGQFGTHIGYELIDAPLNYNYSLSYLFGNGPFYHTGAKLDYTVNDKFGLMVGLVNGWDELSDFNNKKSVTGQVHLVPVEGFQVYANLISGDESNGLSAFGTKKGSLTNLFDLTTSFQVNDVFKIGVNAAYGHFETAYDRAITDEDIAAATPEDATLMMSDRAGAKDTDGDWKGAALYLNYALSPTFGLGLRAERFSDPKGLRYFGPIEATGITLTGDIKLADGNFLIKPEIRYDKTKNDYFVAGADNKVKKNQTTIGAAFIYTFNGSFK